MEKTLKKLFVLSFLFIFIPTLAFGAAYTSSQTGDFEVAATWGGGGAPTAAGDTFTVANTHVVTVKTVDADELGDSVVQSGGTLTFDDAQSVEMNFGNNDLTIDAGGTLNIGTSGNVFDAAFTAILEFNTSSDGTKGIQNSGTVNIYGDPAYYGSDRETFLADSAENNDGDVDIITTDDMSAKWNVGDTIWIHLKNTHVNYVTDVLQTTIVAMAGTAIEVADAVTADAGEGDTWDAIVVHGTRNVIIGKAGATTTYTTANTNRPEIACGGTENIYNANLVGVYGFVGGADNLNSCVINNGRYVLLLSNDKTVTDCEVVSLSSADSSSEGSTYSGCYFLGNIDAIVAADGITVSGGRIFGNDDGFSSSKVGLISDCHIYANDVALANVPVTLILNSYVFGNDDGTTDTQNFTMVNGGWGVDSNGNEIPNDNYDLYNPDNFTTLTFRSVAVPAAGLVYFGRNNEDYIGGVYFEHYDVTLNDHRLEYSWGDVTKITYDDGDPGGDPSIDPDGGTGEGLVVDNLQSEMDGYELPILQQQFWEADETAVTITYEVQTDMTILASNDDELILEVCYHGDNGLADYTCTQESDNIAARVDDADWTGGEMAITFTTKTEGWYRVRIFLKAYEVGTSIWVWPVPTIS